MDVKINLENHNSRYNKIRQRYYIMSTVSSFKDTGNKHDISRGKDCMKIFSKTFKKARNEDN